MIYSRDLMALETKASTNPLPWMLKVDRQMCSAVKLSLIFTQKVSLQSPSSAQSYTSRP